MERKWKYRRQKAKGEREGGERRERREEKRGEREEEAAYLRGALCGCESGSVFSFLLQYRNSGLVEEAIILK